MSLMSKTKSKQRGPPPSLFLHPSATPSHVSLPGTTATGASLVGPSAPKGRKPDANTAGVLRGDNHGRATLKAESTARTTDRTDALWADMQARLEEVELSASGGTHVFGSEHDGKLADLRNAQIALAQAWTRNEADDSVGLNLREDFLSARGYDSHGREDRLADSTKHDGEDDGVGEGISANAAKVVPRPFGPGSGRLDLQDPKNGENTEMDIVIARKRREANDEYFDKVNRGVVDVVSKLENVALAMRAVEQESREVWEDSRSAPESPTA